MRTSTPYNKVVHVEDDGQILMLQETFQHSDDFKGAVGNRFYPVSKKEYKQRMTFKALLEYLESAAECPPQYGSYRKWAKAIREEGEQESVMFDTSYSEQWDEMRKELGLSETDAYIFECVGGGRMFDKDFQGNTNLELSETIREFEKD